MNVAETPNTPFVPDTGELKMWADAAAPVHQEWITDNGEPRVSRLKPFMKMSRNHTAV
jgi:hypothetical protein